MREACLYNNWSFVPIFLNIYRALMRWTPWSFFGGGGGDESPRLGHSPGMRSGGSGDEGCLPNSFRWEFILFIKTLSTGEHSLHISWRSTHLLHLFFLLSWWRHQMETYSASLDFVRGIHRRLRGIHRSPVNSPHTDQWRGALMFSLICAWTGNWVNNQDAGDLRRYRTHYDVTAMWCRMVIQWSGQPWYLSAFNASILNWWNGSNWGVPCIMEKMASNLAHCSTLITIPWNHLYFALSGSLSLWCQIIHKLVFSWGGNKWNIRSL